MREGSPTTSPRRGVALQRSEGLPSHVVTSAIGLAIARRKVCRAMLSLEVRHRPTQRCSPPTSLRARSPHDAAVFMGSTSLHARGPHGPAFLMSSTSLRARGPHGPAVLMGATSLRPPRLGTTFALALHDYVNPRDLESHKSKHPTE